MKSCLVRYFYHDAAPGSGFTALCDCVFEDERGLRLPGLNRKVSGVGAGHVTA